uniref:Uncharacterized protein n=1 Tax=Solanum tuberosum TaxID=4113 RepID=M1A2D1_SOLTU
MNLREVHNLDYSIYTKVLSAKKEIHHKTGQSLDAMQAKGTNLPALGKCQQYREPSLGLPACKFSSFLHQSNLRCKVTTENNLSSSHYYLLSLKQLVR